MPFRDVLLGHDRGSSGSQGLERRLYDASNRVRLAEPTDAR
jgi:hypothetical protein